MNGVQLLLLVIFSNIPMLLSQSEEPLSLFPSSIPPGIFTEPSLTEIPNTQLEPFSQLAHGLRSGPIIIVDSKTFYISNLHYDGKGPDAHFWVGIGPQPQAANGTLVPNEKGSNESLSAYNGENVYIRLPDDLTVYDIDYLGLWCIEYSHNFGFTIIPKNITVAEPIGDNPQYAGSRKIVRLQRCCSERKTLKNKLCVVKNDTFGDQTRPHKAIAPLGNYSLDYFVNYIKCDGKRQLVQLKDNEFVIHKNESFVYRKTGQVLSQDYYCIDTDFRNGAEDSALICVNPVTKLAPNSSELIVINRYFIVIALIYLIFVNN